MRAFERKCPMRNQSRREAPLKRLQEERQKSGKEGGRLCRQAALARSLFSESDRQPELKLRA